MYIMRSHKIMFFFHLHGFFQKGDDVSFLADVLCLSCPCIRPVYICVCVDVCVHVASTLSHGLFSAIRSMC